MCVHDTIPHIITIRLGNLHKSQKRYWDNITHQQQSLHWFAEENSINNLFDWLGVRKSDVISGGGGAATVIYGNPLVRQQLIHMQAATTTTTTRAIATPTNKMRNRNRDLLE